MKFSVGNKVTFINDYGLKFPEKTVVSIEMIDGVPRYHITPTDTPWYPAHERNLILDKDDPVIDVVAGHKIRGVECNGVTHYLVGCTQELFLNLDDARSFAMQNPAATQAESIPGTDEAWESRALGADERFVGVVSPEEEQAINSMSTN